MINEILPGVGMRKPDVIVEIDPPSIDSGMSLTTKIAMCAKGILIAPYVLGRLIGRSLYGAGEVVVRPLIGVGTSLACAVVDCAKRLLGVSRGTVETVQTTLKQEMARLGLFYFIVSNKLDAVRALIQACPEIDLNTIHTDGSDPETGRLSPLTCAIEANLPDMVRLLKELGANLNRPSSIGLRLSPLIHAVVFNKPHMVRLLHDLGADMNALDGNGATALAQAVNMGNLEMIRLLHVLGADLNATGEGLTNPLCVAVQRNNPDAVRLLLVLGADPNVVLKKYLVTPLAYALMRRREEVYSILQIAGANVEEAEALAQMHRVAQAWGLSGTMFHADTRGNVQEGPLDMGMGGLVMPLLSGFVNKFFGEELSGALCSSEKASIREALESAYDGSIGFLQSMTLADSVLAERIKSKKPTVAFLAFEQHLIGLVFCNGKLFVCNRGAGPGRGIEIYSFEDSCITPELMTSLKDLRTINGFREILGSVRFHFEGKIDQHRQKVGNCLFASAKSTFLALVYSVTQDRISDPKARLNLSRETYKKFTAFCRTNSLVEYLARNPAQSVLDKIQQKLVQNSYIHSENKQGLLQRVNAAILMAREEHLRCMNMRRHLEEVQFDKAVRARDAGAMQDLFFQCVCSNNLLLVKKIVEARVGVDLNAVNKSGKTAVTSAVYEGHKEMIRALKQLGADLNRPDGDFLAPMDRAGIAKDFHMCNLLFDLGADLCSPATWTITDFCRTLVRDMRLFTATR